MKKIFMLVILVCISCTKVPIERPELVEVWCRENPGDCFTPDELPAARQFSTQVEIDALVLSMCEQHPEWCETYELTLPSFGLSDYSDPERDPDGHPVSLLGGSGDDEGEDPGTTPPDAGPDPVDNPDIPGQEPGPTPNPDKGGRHDHGKGDHSAGNGKGCDKGNGSHSGENVRNESGTSDNGSSGGNNGKGTHGDPHGGKGNRK